MQERAPGPGAWLVRLAAPLALLMIVLAGLSTVSESRGQFMIRTDARNRGLPDIDLDAPDVNINPPNFDGPDLNTPDLNLPDVDPPRFLGISVNLLIVLATILLLAVLVALLFSRVSGRSGKAKRERLLDDEVDHAGGTPNYSGAGWTAFMAFLAELKADPDTERAVRHAMRYAEAGFGSLPRRALEETPNEWHGRIGRDEPRLAEPIDPLIRTYVGVRFAGAAPTTAERDLAINSLEQTAKAACRNAPPIPEGAR